jgi:GMP synthase-like glutamine amidotransferase
LLSGISSPSVTGTILVELAAMNVLVLQHIACEPPGAYEDALRDRGCTLHRVELDEGEPLPDWREFDAIVAMGGPMSVNDDGELPWLTAEKQAIGEAVRAPRSTPARAPRWASCPSR